MSYGSIVSNAVKIEIANETTGGGTGGVTNGSAGVKDVKVLGFFTKDEATAWFRDFLSILDRNAKRAAMEARARDKKMEMAKHVEPDYVGR